MKKTISAASLLLILFFGAARAQSENQAAYPEVQEALRDFDYSKLKFEAVVFNQATINYWKDNFLPEVKPHIMEKGADCDRLERIAEPLLALSGVKMQLVVFKHKVPTVFTWKETFITFSTAALDLLSDDEAAALVAHEIGHLYFNGRLQKARAAGDAGLSRVIELKCDLVALNLLRLSGKSGDNLLSAVGKLIDARTKLGLQSFQPESPSLENRAELVKRFGSPSAR